MYYFRTTHFFNYIKKLPQSLNEAASNLYADDPCIYYQHKDRQQIQNTLNQGFISFCEWPIDNKLSIRVGKYKIKSIFPR